MRYSVKYGGLTVKEFDTQGDLDSYLADRVQEWTEMGYGYLAHLGADYLKLETDRGTTILLTFTNATKEEPPPYNLSVHL